MEKYVHIHLPGVAVPVVVKADKVEDDLVTLHIKAGEKKVGEFRKSEVVGWSIHDLD